MQDMGPESFEDSMSLTDDIEHLPERKRRELERVVELLFADVEKFQATKQSAKKNVGRVLKVILYGSYARGDWVEDKISGYRSDYDLLIVVNNRSFADEHELWEAFEERLVKEQISRHIKTPVVPIIHTLADINDQLAKGRPFFVDIEKEGIPLYEEADHPFVQPKPLNAEDERREAFAYFTQWFEGAIRMQDLAVDAQGKGYSAEAAFLLHQTTERFYHCALLTLTLYSPKSHRIKVLRSQAESIDGRLIAAWPRDSRVARRNFELLSRAYVEARYSPKYSVSGDELTWLAERVSALRVIVEEICRQRLDLEPR